MARSRTSFRPGPDHPSWKGDQADSGAVHLRLGNAGDHVCVDCGQPAQEWSYIGGAPDERPHKRGPFTTDPTYYVPRCRSCHQQFDRASRSGEHAARARLTWDKARAIRAAYAEGSITLAELARQYGVGKTTVRDVIRRRTWKES